MATGTRATIAEDNLCPVEGNVGLRAAPWLSAQGHVLMRRVRALMFADRHFSTADTVTRAVRRELSRRLRIVHILDVRVVLEFVGIVRVFVAGAVRDALFT